MQTDIHDELCDATATCHSTNGKNSHQSNLLTNNHFLLQMELTPLNLIDTADLSWENDNVSLHQTQKYTNVTLLQHI